MARNEEKALTLFNKWQTFKKDFHAKGTNNQRPLAPSESTSLLDCEKWRREIVRDLTKKIASIRNAALGEHRIRELNDEINKLMKQKHYSEIRIRELGGTVPAGKQYYDIEGKELPGAPGYKYYGAARDLPGVRELFAEQEDFMRSRKQRKRLRSDLMKNISSDYFGYRDDEDGILVTLEAAREAQVLEEVQREEGQRESSDEEDVQLRSLRDISASILRPEAELDEESDLVRKEREEKQRKLEEALMEKKKQALLSQFLS